LQALEALGDKAFAPAADGVAVAAQFDSDVLVGRVVRFGGAQNETAAESQGLGSGAGTGKRFEFTAKFVLQFDNRAEGARHGSPPCRFDQMDALGVILAILAPDG
jgi:hypothetical protein